jgi:hypothetical protein
MPYYQRFLYENILILEVLVLLTCHVLQLVET